MDQAELQELEKQIKDTIEETKKDIERLQDATDPIAPDVAIGRLSRLEALGEKGVREKNLMALMEKYTNLTNTLQRLNHPNFADCSDCGASIPKARIIAIPESTLCVKCA